MTVITKLALVFAGLFILQFCIGLFCMALQLSGLLGASWSPFPWLLIVEGVTGGFTILFGVIALAFHSLNKKPRKDQP